MIYFLKFCAGWVLPPGIFILAFLALGIYVWRHSGRGASIYSSQRGSLGKGAGTLLILLAVVVYLFCMPWVAEKSMGWLEGKYLPPKNPQGDVIIMLGGGAYPDTPDVGGQGTLCAAPDSRLLTAARLQRKLDVPILLSGGQVYSDTGAEAKIAERILLDLGVPQEQILVETKSVNTTQNAKFSVELMKEKHLTRPILVTSAFHMRRGMLNFEKQGLEPVPFPADYRTALHHEFHYVKLRPSADAAYDNAVVVQEVVRGLVTRYIE